MARDVLGILNDRVTAVLGFSELLLEESYGPLTPEQKKIFMTVVGAAREVRDILRRAQVTVSQDQRNPATPEGGELGKR